MAEGKAMADVVVDPREVEERQKECDGLSSDSMTEEQMEAGKVEKGTEVRREVLWLLYTIVTFDMAVNMVIVPFLPAFFEDRLGVHGIRLGASVGSVTSAFCLGNSLSSAYMGHLSDVHGRRPVLLFGLCVAMISVFMFPLSTAVWMVIANRFMCGFFNCNLTISKSCVADVTKKWESSRRSAAFGYLGAAWGLSRFFSSFFSGLTTGIKIPFLPFVADNPYFFPCLGVSALLAITTTVAYFCLPETHPRSHGEDPAYRPAPSDSSVETETPVPPRGSIFGRLRFLYAVGGPVLIRLLCAHMMHQFLNGGVLTITVLFWALDPSKGGFGLSSNGIGLVFGYFGAVGLVFQLFCFKPLVKAFGVRRMYHLGLFLLGFGSLLLWSGARLVLLLSSELWKVAVMLLTATPMSVGFMCGLPVLNNLLANAAPPEVMGLTQGLAQSSGAFARMVGPIVFGSVFSYSVAHHSSVVGFAIVASLYLCTLVATLGLPPSVETPAEDAPKEGIAYPSPSTEQARYLETSQNPCTK